MTVEDFLGVSPPELNLFFSAPDLSASAEEEEEEEEERVVVSGKELGTSPVRILLIPAEE